MYQLYSVYVCKLIHFWEVTCAADKYVGLLYSWRAWRLLVINVLLAAENQIRLLDSHCPSATHVFCHCKHVVEFHSSKTHKGTFICYVVWFFLEAPNNPREHIFSDKIFWTTHPTLYAYVIYEWPLIDQVNWISMRSFKQSSTPSRISSSIYTPFIIAFMYVMRQNLWQEISHIGTFITEYAQPRFTFWLFRPNHDIVHSKITLSHWFLPFGVFEFLRRGFCRGGTRYSIGRWIHRYTGGGSVTRGIFLIAADTACSSCQVGTRHQRRVFDLIASIFTCNADQKKVVLFICVNTCQKVHWS